MTPLIKRNIPIAGDDAVPILVPKGTGISRLATPGFGELRKCTAIWP